MSDLKKILSDGWQIPLAIYVALDGVLLFHGKKIDVRVRRIDIYTPGHHEPSLDIIMRKSDQDVVLAVGRALSPFPEIRVDYLSSDHWMIYKIPVDRRA
jgi:hypothetical protein